MSKYPFFQISYEHYRSQALQYIPEIPEPGKLPVKLSYSLTRGSNTFVASMVPEHMWCKYITSSSYTQKYKSIFKNKTNKKDQVYIYIWDVEDASHTVKLKVNMKQSSKI